MPVKVKYSDNYWAKRKRIQRLPKIINNVVRGAIKKDALGIIETFHDGIKKETLGLEPLEESTVLGKAGYSQPSTPLYKAGDERKLDSYVNMLRIRKLKNGWKVYPSWGKHWEASLELRQLFIVHEYGTKIVQKNGTIINIPPRPAFLLSYQKYLSDKIENKKETAMEVSKAITEYINTANEGRFRPFISLLKKKSEVEE